MYNPECEGDLRDFIGDEYCNETSHLIIPTSYSRYRRSKSTVLGMPDPDDIREAPSIAPAFAACLMVYRHLYLSLTRPDCRVADQVDVSKVYDNYGRLNVRGSDPGALRTGRGSLDDVLRTNENLRSIVLDTISDLIKSIKRGRLPPSTRTFGMQWP